MRRTKENKRAERREESRCRIGREKADRKGAAGTEERRRSGRAAGVLALALAAALLCGCTAGNSKEPEGDPVKEETGLADGAAGGWAEKEQQAAGGASEGRGGNEAQPAGEGAEAEEISEAGSTAHVQAEVKEDPDRLGEGAQMPGGEETGPADAANPAKGSAKDSREKFSGDIAALDNTSQGWGQGVQFDEQNRPGGAVSAQEAYGKYSADFIRTGEEEANHIYLTFDEGYENGYTAKILDVLKEKNCPAVFFVTQPYAEQEPELIRRMIDEGHIVGNHSVNHPADGLPSQSREQQEQELMGLHGYVKEQFGYEMSLFRYPAGKFSEQSLAIVQNLDYTSVFWSFAYADWDPAKQPEEGAALSKLTERLHPGAIYLLHAVSETNANILGQFIDSARAAGYEFASYR